MICIKCSSETKVTNSRPHKKTPTVWRRRQCLSCGTVFSTNEVVADDSYAFRVQGPNGMTNFSLPRLMLSIATCLTHRPSPASGDEAYWLSQTVAQQVQASATDVIVVHSLAEMTYHALSNFDATAGIQYGARQGLVTNVAQRPARGRPRTTHRGIV